MNETSRRDDTLVFHETRIREQIAAELEEYTPQELRLHMGELTAQEMRAVLSFIHWQAAILRNFK